MDVRDKFINSHNADVNSYTFIYYYEKPRFHISCKEFYDYCERGKLIKLNSPLYFYHVVNKNADLSRGLLSLEYMYQHKLFDLFDGSVNKYKRRIVKDWNIAKYKNRDEESLSREEILDALKIFRGDFGTSYIYFFKYPPYKELGKKMEELLKVKDIYRININDEAVQKNIKNIFYGYENSSSDSKILNKSYYENISKEEYFSNYDDKLSMNFARLNHISIAFKDEFCPIEFLEKL